MKNLKIGKCIILNGFCRNSLAITRSLGKKGIAIDIVAYKDGKKIDEFRERHASKFVDKVYFIQRDISLLDQIISILTNNEYEFIFAGGTDSSNFISKYKLQLSKYTNVIAEDYDKHLKAHDKHKVLEVIQKLNIPFPKSYKAKNKKELMTISKKLNGKAIVKFPDSFASKGIFIANKDETYFVENYSKKFGFNYDDGQYPIIQELLEGSLYDTTSFSINGKPNAILTQKRVMTSWLKGGGGVVNRTTDNPEIINHAQKIINELKWSGHMEIDWIFNKRDQKFYFIEINPKFWGTTQLTISAGFDYPYWNILMNKGIEVPENIKYKIGLTYRWIEEELLAITNHSSNLFVFFWEFIKFFGRFFQFNVEYSFQFKDFKPFKGIIIETMWSIWKNNIQRKA